MSGAHFAQNNARPEEQAERLKKRPYGEYLLSLLNETS